MKFFLPDAQDYVDPEYDFLRDESPPERQRYHSDVYAHELLGEPPYDGLLVSKAIVDGAQGSTSRYTVAQRHRLLREGVHRFFRLDRLKSPDGTPFPVMGDCGAFSYWKEPVPPYSVDEVLDFYDAARITHGFSIDHIIPEHQPVWDGSELFADGPPEQVQFRYDLTLRLAGEFRERHAARGCRFTPIGVVQGWSPKSYAVGARRLIESGYDYIALGGLVPLKTPQLLSVVDAVMEAVAGTARVHLLGVVRWPHVEDMISKGVTSFDSTSPLRQAFLDQSDNYYTERGTYPAIRVPQIDGNARLKRRVLAGVVDQDEVRKLEQGCLQSVRHWAERPGDCSGAASELEDVLDALDAFGELFDPGMNRRAGNRRTLADRPWADCACRVCRDLGVEVVLFRAANRNRRRGFHNLHVAAQRLQTARRNLTAAASRAREEATHA